MTMLRGLLEAAMARGVAVGHDLPATPARRGYAYVCQRCDVYGYLGPDDPASCWSCEEPDQLIKR